MPIVATESRATGQNPFTEREEIDERAESKWFSQMLGREIVVFRLERS